MQSNALSEKSPKQQHSEKQSTRQRSKQKGTKIEEHQTVLQSRKEQYTKGLHRAATMRLG
ncbi:hypothetical protein AMTR_s00020p00250210 [Amborella trichopoda]|uniref:Uncharacterized protein n=1 Tax=Amborella trichopoda TaxID=13333 RepID=W1PX16_AMBTC|nr:hypothetical protein AMTR_s00020p00250210 [Amborella trichopoda]